MTPRQKEEPAEQPVNLSAGTGATPVMIGEDTYLLDPGSVPLILKMRIEGWVSEALAAAADKELDAETYEAALELQSIDLTARALGIDNEKAAAFGPLARWKLLSFLASGLLPAKVTKP